MFLLRSARLSDLPDLYRLSQLVLFINLPPDEAIIKRSIEKSIRSFSNPSQKLSENDYIFVLEDLDEKKVIGVSMIHAQHGTEKEPHFFFRVGHESKFSQTLNTGFIHGTLKFGLEQNGPTEIGGLVLHPEYRGLPGKLGKQLSFVRFLYISRNRSAFKEVIHSELMPPLDAKGNSPLWEAIGRRFLNMEYHEADELSRKNKEFILSLFPTDTIYQVLLPMEARDAIGKVGRETQPVKKMLESIGFQYANEVDPFDGGPHYRANTSDIAPIQDLTKLVYTADESNTGNSQRVILELEKTQRDPFTAIAIEIERIDDKFKVSSALKEHVTLVEGQEYSMIPI